MAQATSIWRLAPVVVAQALYFFSNFFSRAIINQVLVEVICVHNNDSDCNSANVSSDASLLALYSELVWNIPAVLLSGIYGQLLDRAGRKMIMTVAILGYLLYFSTIFAIAMTKTQHYFELVLLSSFVAGCMGGFNSFTMAMFAYATDITMVEGEREREREGGGGGDGKSQATVTQTMMEQRVFYYSIIDAVLSAAKVVAPYCSGTWAQNQGFAPPLGFASALCFLAVVWVQLVMTETTPAASRRLAQSIPLDPFKTFRNLMYVYSSKGAMRDKVTSDALSHTVGVKPFDLPVQITSYFFFFFAYMCDRSIFVLYEKRVFGLESEAIGLLDSFQNLVTIVSLLFLPVAVGLLGRGVWSDQFYVVLGYAARVVYYICFSLVPEGHTSKTVPTLMQISALLILTGPAAPRSRSIATNSVPPSEHSAVQASFSALQALSLLLSTLANLLYSLTVGDGFPKVAAVWWMCAGLSTLALALSSWQYFTQIWERGGREQEGSLQEPLLIDAAEEEALRRT